MRWAKEERERERDGKRWRERERWGKEERERERGQDEASLLVQ